MLIRQKEEFPKEQLKMKEIEKKGVCEKGGERKKEMGSLRESTSLLLMRPISYILFFHISVCISFCRIDSFFTVRRLYAPL